MEDTQHLQLNNRLLIMAMETIFENISEYQNDIEGLVKAFQDVGINDYEQFQSAKIELHASVPRAIQIGLKEYYEGYEERVWNEYMTKDSEQGYREYLTKFPEGKYCDEARKRIESFKDRKRKELWQAEWQKVDQDDIDALQRFANECDFSEYREKALDTIKALRSRINGVNELKEKIEKLKNDKDVTDLNEEIYKAICEFINIRGGSKMFGEALKMDNNLINADVAKKLKEINFPFIEIDYEFVKQLDTTTESPNLSLSEASKIFSKVSKTPSTEVYFWGIPSSGKTCALGAILSCANNVRDKRTSIDHIEMDIKCQGYGYMNRLSNIFNHGCIGVLPGGTAINSTYEMGFTLVTKDNGKRREYPMTFIDLAGELIRCMYKKDAKEKMNDGEDAILQTMTDILSNKRSENRKMHFFVVEYGAENRLYEGLPQKTYLEAAVSYIKNTDIFKRDTDAVSIIITKADKSGVTGDELMEKMKSYITSIYGGFYRRLKDICEMNEINGGRVDVMPFSLGQVCFQTYCRFDDKAALNIIKFIIDHAYGNRTGKMSNILNWFRK